MKLEIKLKDPKYCDECPCKNEDYENGSKCNLDYWRSDEEVWGWRNKAGHFQTGRPTSANNWDLVYRRPKKCITDNGL